VLLHKNKKIEQMVSDIINVFALLTSLVTASSVFLHDTHLDKAAMAATALPTTTVVYEEQSNKMLNFGDAHTHVERVTFAQAVRDFGTGNPQVQPRNEDKKYLLQNRVARGHHAFDNYNLPIV
jgi:hypothetical protein